MSEKNTVIPEVQNEKDCSDTIGILISSIRIYLSMTREIMAKSINISAETICEIEKGNDDILSLDMKYRIYFFAQEIIDNKSFGDFVKSLAIRLKNKIYDDITGKVE